MYRQRHFTLVLLVGLLAMGATGCMEDDPGPPAWFVQQWQSAQRHYDVTTGEGENEVRVGTLRRRGTAYILQDVNAKRLAKASVRRNTDRVVARDAGGKVVGSTQMLHNGVSFIDTNDKQVAVLHWDSPAQRLVIDGTGMKENKALDPKAKPGLRVSDRSGLSTLGEVLLAESSLDPEIRLSLAVHVSEIGAPVPPGTQDWATEARSAKEVAEPSGDGADTPSEEPKNDATPQQDTPESSTDE